MNTSRTAANTARYATPSIGTALALAWVVFVSGGSLVCAGLGLAARW